MLAGPLCGAIPVFLSGRFQVLGIIAALLTVYNLLPFWPLDGGRILNEIEYRSCKWNKTIHIYKALIALSLGILIIRCGLFVLMIPVSLYLREIFLANKGKKGYNSATICKEVSL